MLLEQQLITPHVTITRILVIENQVVHFLILRAEFRVVHTEAAPAQSDYLSAFPVPLQSPPPHSQHNLMLFGTGLESQERCCGGLKSAALRRKGQP